MKFLSDIEVEEGLKDSGGNLGSSGQLLSSTVTGTAWIDPSTIVAEAATLVVIACKNTSGATIVKGTPVYQTGNVGSTATIEIAPADALISANKLPAIGLLQTTLNNNGLGNVVITGELTNFTTSPIDGVTPTTGDKIFVKSGGGLTLTKPTGEGNGIQNMGLVGKVSGGNAGSITVSSIMRTNDVPNLPEGRIWVGDGNTIVSDTVYIDEPNLKLGIGTINPGSKLTVAGDVLINSGEYLSWGTAGVTSIEGSTASNKLQFRTNSTDRMIINDTGVGIGTPSPAQKLHVAGNARVTGAYYDSNNSAGSNGQVLSSANSGTTTEWTTPTTGTIGGSITDNQIAVGASTTNNIEGSSVFSYVPLTLGSKTSARLIVEGRLQISDDMGNGAANLYIGVSAGSTSANGANVGIGLEALKASAGGGNNCAIGNLALRRTTLGDRNNALGNGSLFWLAGDGQDDNIAIGYDAAQYYSTGTDQLTQSSQGVYIGNYTRASANNISNEIAIGYGAVGGGSDTITLGNSSVDLLRIPGLNATSGQVLAYNTTAGGFEAATPSSGGGTIGGSIAATQIAVGDAANSIEGSSLLTLTNVPGLGAYDMLRIGNGTTGENQVLLDINTKGTATSRGRLTLSDAGVVRGFLGITGGDQEVTLLSNANLALSGGAKVTIDGGSTSDIVIASASGSKVGIGNTSPDEKLDVEGRIKASKGVQVGIEADNDAASGLVGTFRYRLVNGTATAGTNYSFVDMCMQTGTTGGLNSYEWVNIVTNRW